MEGKIVVNLIGICTDKFLIIVILLQSKLTSILLAPLAVVRTFREFIGTDLDSASQNRVIEEKNITSSK